jgi:cardiolipin synthase
MESLFLFIIAHILLALNIGCIVAIIFFQRKEPTTVFAWVLVLIFLPILGFILYMLFGHNYIRQNRINLASGQTYKKIKEQIAAIKKDGNWSHRMMYMNLARFGGIVTDNNKITTFTDGAQKFAALIDDINKAERYIHMVYFIFKGDIVGRQIIDALTEKCKQGVDVKVVYDDVGSILVASRVFKELIKAGGEVHRYSPLFTRLLSANYRNHRKLVTIDDKIGYIGGMNVGKEYMGGHSRLDPWRDTHLRIEGTATQAMELMFQEDLAYARKGEYKKPEKDFDFGQFKGRGDVVQIVSSIPKPEHDSIHIAFLRMLTSAEKYVYIHTPYLIPDRGFLNAVRMAAAGGVDLRVMIPGKPDKRTVYIASLFFARLMHAMGAKIYIYDGFLHSKMIVADDEVASIGSTNMDIRSFNLSFEANAFVYSRDFAAAQREQFLLDMQNCTLATTEYFKNLPVYKRVLMPVFQLFSPLL